MPFKCIPSRICNPLLLAVLPPASTAVGAQAATFRMEASGIYDGVVPALGSYLEPDPFAVDVLVEVGDGIGLAAPVSLISGLVT
ncbi:MAG: hypothetical protein AAF264_08730, partial [Pseudomonadota bacterium]